MIKEEHYIIDEIENKYKACVVFYETVACLCFYANEQTIQGHIDGTLGWDNIATGIENLEMMPDDGAFLVDFSEYSQEQIKNIKQPLIEWFRRLYFDNKKKFIRNINKDLRESEKYAKKSAKVFRCQSCNQEIKKQTDLGTNNDGSKNKDYCLSCYRNGDFVQQMTVEEMAYRLIEKHMDYWQHHNTEDGRKMYVNMLKQLKRWNE